MTLDDAEDGVLADSEPMTDFPIRLAGSNQLARAMRL
jgi:hypothetical protein